MHAPRSEPFKLAPGAYKVMAAVEDYIRHCGLELPLLELVKMRVSQINGCAFCLDMHSKDARRAGETEQRLYLLNAWDETHIYTDREKAALAWAEALTLVSETHVPDAVYDRAKAQFTDVELANLTLAVTQINSWNRFQVAFRATHS